MQTEALVHVAVSVERLIIGSKEAMTIDLHTPFLAASWKSAQLDLCQTDDRFDSWTLEKCLNV